MTDVVFRLRERGSPPRSRPAAWLTRLATMVTAADPNPTERLAISSLAGAAVPLALTSLILDRWWLLAVSAIGPVVAALLVRRARARAVQRVVAELPALLEAVARARRAGATSTDGLRDAGESTTGRLGRLVDEALGALALGASADVAFARLTVPGAGGSLAMARLALEYAHDRAGGAAALDAAATALRDRQHLRREAHGLTAQARLSAQVLIGLPIGFVAIGFAVGADQAGLLFRPGIGRWCLVAGVVLDAIGAWWLRAQRLAVGR